MPVTRTYKRYRFSGTLNTTQADVVQVPSGKSWVVLRAWNQSVGSTGTVLLDRTDSSNTQQTRVESRAGGASETAYTEIAQLAGAVFTSQDKLRGQQASGSGTWRVTLFVIEET